MSGFSVCLERAENESVTRQQELKDLYSHVVFPALEKQRYHTSSSVGEAKVHRAHGRAHGPMVIPLTNFPSTPLVFFLTS